MTEKFIQYAVANKEKITSDSVIFELIPDKIYNFLPGQFIPLILEIKGKEHVRDYSICSIPGEKLQIVVKAQPDGFVSRYLFEKIRIGDIIKGLPPKGDFIFKPEANRKRNIYLFAGGSGITPIFSILRSALIKEPKSNVYLVYQNSSLENIILDKELRELEKQNKYFELIYSVSKPPKKWIGFHGRINQANLEIIFKAYKFDISADNVFYICGPEGMKKTIDKFLIGNNIPVNRIFMETFSGRLPVQDIKKTGFENAKIVFRIGGEEYSFEADSEKDLLESGLLAGLDLPYSCHKAVCMSCVARLENGSVAQIIKKEEIITRGDIFLCRSFLRSPEIFIRID